ncbi:FG-GAP repeat domain-containing protein [Thalassoglobus sp.]|uniref:FG-GAP repeat domain-containing protein n=1 Tax=Thalassoglobus sp. TaxID=2795869 RepID=UPI003AA7B920
MLSKQIILLCLSSLTISSGCRSEALMTPSDSATQSSNRSVLDDKELKQQIEHFCGACHKTPQPSSFPKSAWYEEVKRGYDFYYTSTRTDLTPPPQAEVTAYYRALAPETLFEEKTLEVSIPSSFSFRKETLRPFQSDSTKGDAPGTSFLEWSKVQDQTFQFSDMKHGLFSRLALDGRQIAPNSESAISPVAVRRCDLNGNQQDDLIIADLGSFLPEDHHLGKVLWIPDFRSKDLQPVTILEGVGRVADVRSGDFNNDGKEDVIVAEFGWHVTGGIHLLTNQEIDNDSGTFQFHQTLLDDRPGTIHIPTVDLDNDGRLDFVALISQEFEEIVAFLNREDGFEKVVLYSAPDPSYGSSGIELVDLDQDGDMDILYTNGDTFDSALAKPYHGVSWLENSGNLKFQEHRLALFPGAHRALADDLDGDGDLDIVAVSLLPHKVLQSGRNQSFDSVIWLEQVEPGRFQRYTIESGDPVYSCMEIGDFDSDGNVDIAVGHFVPSKNSESAALSIFWNEGIRNTE